jgi:acyl dehydratase
MLDYEVLKSWQFGDIVHTYAARDTMLYALGIGLGADPMHEGQLRFVLEKSLQAVPTMASVLGTPGFWYRDPRTGVDFVKIVHGEQSIRLLRPIAPAASVVARHRVVSITDKGAGKGAVAVITRDISEQASGEPVAQSVAVIFFRGDGGYSLKSGRSDPPPAPLPAVPEREPDVHVSLDTLARQALIYRLSGDYNPLHADPDVARAAGFSRPILHGLCTYGMAAHAVLQAVTSYDATRIRAVAARFTSPVYPGETIRFDLWERDSSSFHLRATVAARDTVVLNNGVIELS